MSDDDSQTMEWLEGRANLAAAVDRLLGAARSQVALCTLDLDPALLDREEVIATVRDLAVKGVRPRIRILFEDPEPAIKGGHRLIHLARRLPSFIELRRLTDEAGRPEALYMVADETWVLRRQLNDDLRGRLWRSPPEARRHLADFETRWEYSVSDPRLRALHI